MTTELAGRYLLEKIIGEGGMATVWRGRDTRLDRSVAVKVMSERYASDPDFRARFLQEARAAASFSHPNVVDVLDYGDEDGAPYIVMELVEGEDLRGRIAREGHLPADEVARIGAAIAAGLAAAHRRGLVHRDIKPANILIAEDGTPKLTDFGIVRALGSATQTRAGLTLGSVHYLSPEQVQGARVDARSDLYSLGVVLYEAATGERPFDDDAPAAIAVRRLNEAPRPPHAVEPSVPPWLSSIIERAMARDPERRYQTASELERDLRTRHSTAPAPIPMEHTVGMPVPVPIGAPIRATPAVRARGALVPRRNAALFFVLVLVALGLIAGGVLLLANQATVAVPSVVGLARDDALRQLDAAGLRWNVLNPDVNDQYPAGSVYKQDPAPPRRVRTGEFVTLWISAGKGDVAIPPVVNMTYQDAVAELAKAGLGVRNTVDQSSATIAAGRVIDSNPGAGAIVRSGYQVILYMSTGPAATPTPVPTPTPTQAPPPTQIFTPPPTPTRLP